MSLNSCVRSIPPFFQHLLGKYEQDFLRAYFSYMEKVNKELAYLKNKVVETAQREMNDDQIGKLSDQIEFFAKEAEIIN